MAQATLTARVDEKDKINFDAFCSTGGQTHGTLKADDSLLHGAGGRMADASQSEQEE